MYTALAAVLGKTSKEIILSYLQEVIKQNLVGMLDKILSNEICTQFLITI